MAEHTSKSPKKKILFVDSDITSYCLVSILFERHDDIEIIHTRCGTDAIRLFSEDPFIDLVITEIIVPEQDGFEIVKAIKRINPSVPVIAQTACVFNNMEKRCLETGFNEYISKPVNLKLFARMVKKMLQH